MTIDCFNGNKKRAKGIEPSRAPQLNFAHGLSSDQVIVAGVAIIFAMKMAELRVGRFVDGIMRTHRPELRFVNRLSTLLALDNHDWFPSVKMKLT